MKDTGRRFTNLFGGAGALRRRSLVAGTALVCLFYLLAAFADFLAPYDYRAQSLREPFAPPAGLRFRDNEGRWRLRPFIYAKKLVDPLERRYQEDAGQTYPLELFVTGYEYQLFGLTTNRHLFGVSGAGNGGEPRIYLLGTDALGRDRLSRLIIATRFSLLTGPLATIVAAALGVLIGSLSGYAGRAWTGAWSGEWLDSMLMRVADAMMALPALVMILAARAAFPLALPPVRAALLLIGIFVVLGWAEMARLTRGLVLELRAREFVVAALSLGMSPSRVMLRHILPNAARPLIVQALLMLPTFLLAETSLSFLGVGLQEPEASWGSLLASAADITLLEREHAWTLLSPAAVIMLFVLGVRLVGAGLEIEGNDDA